MRVAIDGRLLERRRGVGNMVHHLIGALARLPDPPELRVYVTAGTPIPGGGGPVQYRVLPCVPYPVWEQVLVPWAAARDGAEVLHSPANTGPLRVPGRIAHVVTVHDVLFLRQPAGAERSPSVYQRLGRRYRRAVSPPAARRAAAVIAVSEHTRAQLERVAGIAADRAHVVREAAGDEFRALPADDALAALPPGVDGARPYVLALGAIDPRKNTLRVLDAFARFRAAGFADHQLVVAGIDHGFERRLRVRAGELGIRDRVVLLAYVTTAQLVALYNRAELFLYPSLAEGFGLPVLEAMACGTPVIASCTTAIPEVAGAAAILVEPTDTNALTGAMRVVAGDAATRGRLRELGPRRAAEFSWGRAAAETLAVYERALGARDR